MWQIFALLGCVFAPLAAAMAFLITYDEWSKHLLPRRVVMGRSLHAAAVTLVVFLVGSVVVGELLLAAISGH
jgi:hypothetical protein